MKVDQPFVEEEPEGAGSWDTRPRHPRLDEFWRDHHKLLRYYCRRLQKAYGGSTHDYLGTLILRLNRILWTFDESRSRFSTYFSCRLHDDVWRTWLRRESEWRDVLFYAMHTRDERKKDTHVAYATYESEYNLYRVPDRDEGWAQDVLECFGSAQALWEFLVRGCNGRERFVLEQHFREGATIQVLGDFMGVSKQRVQQIEARALKHIKRRLEKVEEFMRLFN